MRAVIGVGSALRALGAQLVRVVRGHAGRLLTDAARSEEWWPVRASVYYLCLVTSLSQLSRFGQTGALARRRRKRMLRRRPPLRTLAAAKPLLFKPKATPTKDDDTAATLPGDGQRDTTTQQQLPGHTASAGAAESRLCNDRECPYSRTLAWVNSAAALDDSDALDPYGTTALRPLETEQPSAKTTDASGGEALKDVEDDPLEFIAECPICYDEFSPRSIVAVYQCGHAVCARCATRWAAYSARCPTCRAVHR